LLTLVAHGGKRGSFRYVYLYLKHRERIYLLLMFGKSEQATLSTEQTRQVAELIEAIKQEAT
jgi:hypothetical protein